MTSQIRLHQANAENNPFQYLNIIRKTVQWWNGRQMDRYIGNELDKRYTESRADPEGKRTKAVIDLVLQAYLPENDTLKRRSSDKKLDPDFRAFAISQIRLFMFVGHDSTSSTICYILHLLSTHPNALSRIRAEHDRIFGTDISNVSTILKSMPYLTYDIPYTTAVIKESLRLFPPASSSRAGHPSVFLTSDSGKTCPTENTAAVFSIHTEMHRAPTYWKRPEDFLPERWLASPDDELYPIKGAYRAFEIGPRNCVAQTYVMTELRVILACVVRQFNFYPAYEEWDRLHPMKRKRIAAEEISRTYRGERVYQIEEGAAHPVEHYPCRVKVST